MFKSVPVDWVFEAYLVSGTNGSFTEFILYTLIFKTHQCNHCVGLSFQLYYSPSRITLIEDQTKFNQLQRSHKLIPFKGVYGYLVLCKMFWIICERTHELFLKNCITNYLHTASKQDQELIVN